MLLFVDKCCVVCGNGEDFQLVHKVILISSGETE